MQNYKDLKVWEEGHLLTLKIYKATMNFPDKEKYGLTNHIRRSAFSVPSNIAEGCINKIKAMLISLIKKVRAQVINS